MKNNMSKPLPKGIHYFPQGQKVINAESTTLRLRTTFKVQVPLSVGPGMEEMWMVYPEDRKPVFVIKPTDELRSHLGRDMKGYFDAEVYFASPDATPEFTVYSRVKGQPW